MDDQDVRERLLAAAVVPPPSSATINDDLDRGRRGRRRRTFTIASGSLAVIALLGTSAVALGLATQSNGADRLHQGGFAHAGQTTSPTPTPETASTTRRILSVSEIEAALSDEDLGVPTRLTPWEDELVHLAYLHLDPGHRYIPDRSIEYNGRSGVSFGPNGDDEFDYYIGMTLNWSDDDPSQGRIDVALVPARDGSLGCNDFPPCQPIDDPTYGEIRLGGDPTGTKGFQVIVSRPDGVVAGVTVSPIGRGPVLTPSQAPLPSLDQVLAFATDPGLGLPTG